MTEFEEYQQTGMLGGYKPERVKMREAGDGKDIPVYPDGVGLLVENDSIGITRVVYIDGRLFRVSSMFDLRPTKTPTDAMIRVIDNDLKKESFSG